MFDFWKRRENSNSNQDEFDGLDDFDFDDFGFESEPVSPDRSPITDAARGVKDSVIGSFKDTDISNAARKMLPDEYGNVFDTKDKIKDTYREVFDHAVKEFQPYKEDIKNLTKRALSASEAVLPEKLYAKLSDLVKTESKFSQESRESRERSAVTAELSSIFEAQIKVDQEREKREDKKNDIKEVISHERHKDVFAQLDAIRKAAISQVNYQDNVLIKYQRKHLENEIKQTNILLRIAEETSAMRAESKSALDIISKNTGLPDYVKLLGSERFKANLTQRFHDTIIDSISNSNRFIPSILREARDGAKGWISGVVNGLGSAVSAADQVDLTSMEDMGISRWETAGQFAGSFIGDWLKNKQYSKIKDIITGKKEINGKKFPWADQVKKGGHQATLILNNLPYYLTQFIRNAETSTSNGFALAGLDILDTLVGNATKDKKETLKTDSVSDLFQPAVFTNRVSTSITDIIPGYLSKILREITVLRTGDNSVKELIYDHQSKKFDTAKNIGNRILSTVITDKQRESFRRNAELGFKDIDVDNSISVSDRQELAKLFNNSIGKRNINFNKDYLTKVSTYEKIFDKDKASKIAKMMQEYLKDDNGEKLNKIIAKYSDLGGGTNIKGYSQLMLDAGYRDSLRLANIINDNNTLNKDYLYNYLSGTTNLDSSDVILDRENNIVTRDETLVNDNVRSRNLDEVRNQYLHDMLDQMRNCCDKEDRKAFRESLLTQISTLHNDVITSQQAMLEAILGIGQIQIINQSGQDNRVDIDNLRNRINSTGSRLSSTFKNLITKGITGGAGLYGKALSKAKNISFSGLGGITDSLSNITTLIRSKYDAMDVYIRGEAVPRLRRHVMAAGGYFNEDGSVIKTFRDIKGKVLDASGNIVMSNEDFQYASIFDRTKNSWVKFTDIFKNTLVIGKDFFSNITNRVFNTSNVILQKGKAVLSHLTNEVLANIDSAHDVYIKGNNLPALLRRKMLNGEYFDAFTGEVIRKVSDIKGAIVDEKGDIVLTEEDIQTGLVDKTGREFKRLLTYSIDKSKQLLRYARVKTKRFIRQAGRFSRNIISKVQGLFKNRRANQYESLSEIQVEAQSDTVTLLEAIYNLLDKRLPGSKRLGDTDGDGDIENSVADIIQRRREENRRKREQVNQTNTVTSEETKQSKGMLGGLFGWMTDKVKDLAKYVLGGLATAGGLLVKPVIAGIKKAGISLASILGTSLKKVFTQGAKILGDGIMSILSKIPGIGGALSAGGGFFSKIGKTAKNIGRSLFRGKNKWIAAAATIGAGLGLFPGNAEASEGEDYYEAPDEDSLIGNSLDAGFMGYNAYQGTKVLNAARAGTKLAAGRVVAPLGMGIDVWDAYKGFQTGDTSRQIQGTMGASGAAIGGAIGSLFFGAGIIPGMLIGGAVGWLGGKITNLTRKWLKKGKLTEMEEVRFIQYGFDPKRDKDKIDRILNMEKILEQGIVANGSKYDINIKSVDTQGLLEIFGITENSTHPELRNIDNFIRNRVIPVITANVLALRTIEPGKILEYMDKLKDIDKIKVINSLRSLSPNTYSHTAPVFTDSTSGLLSSKEVNQYLERKEHQLKEKYKKETLKDKDGFFSSPFFESDLEYSIRKQEEEKKIDEELANITKSNTVLTNVTTNVKDASKDNITITVSDDLLRNGFISPDGSIKLDAFTCIRYVAYGLKEFTDMTKITQLRKIEEFLGQANVVSITGNGTAKFTGGENNIVKRIAHILNQPHVSNRGLRSWIMERLIPVYTQFRASLGFVGIKVPDNNRIKGLKFNAKLIIANSVLGALQRMEADHYNMHGAKSIFDSTASPWAGYTVSDSSSYAKEYLNYLEMKADKETKIETQKATDSEKAKALVKDVTTPNTSNSTNVSNIAQPSIPLMMKNASNQYTHDRVSEVLDTVTNSSDSSTVYTPGSGMAPLANSQPMYDASQLDFSNNDSTLAGIAKAMLEKLGTSSSDIDKYLPILVYTLQKYGITKREHMAAFIAQIAHESKFKPKRENMKYSSLERLAAVWPNRFGRNGTQRSVAQSLVNNPKGLAIAAYGDRMGNRPGTDDGWIYRGGGFMQLTGKDNYAAFAKSSGIDVLSNPDLITDPNVAMLAAGHFWKTRNLGRVLDTSGYAKVSETINGGSNGMSDRIQKYRAVLSVTNAPPVDVKAPQLNNFKPTISDRDIAKTSGSNTDVLSTPGPSSTYNRDIGMGIGGFTKASMTTTVEGSIPNSQYQINPGNVVSTTAPISTDMMDISPSSTGYGGSVNTRNAITQPRVNGDSYVDGTDKGLQDEHTVRHSNSKAVKAAKIARSKAGSTSQGKCARFVRIALQAAGYKFEPKGSAYMYVDVLPKLGWTRMRPNTPYQIGDIIIFGNNNAHPHGHIQIFDGSNWISDFVQKNLIPYRNKNSAGAISHWRDTNSVPSSKDEVNQRVSNQGLSNKDVEDKIRGNVIPDDRPIQTESTIVNNQSTHIPSEPNTYKETLPEIKKPVLTSSPISPRVDRETINTLRQEEYQSHMKLITESVSIAKEHLSISKEQLEVLKQLVMKLDVKPTATPTPQVNEMYKEPKELTADRSSSIYSKRMQEKPAVALSVSRAGNRV